MSQKTGEVAASEKSDCPLRPKFESQPSDGVQQVKLTQDKYVQLLVEARETDPGCWPPGMEGAAKMLERAQAIEEACISKHGEFDPAKLTKKVQDEYFQIHLALDDLQDGISLAVATAGAAHTVSQDSAPDKSETLVAVNETLPLPAWPEFAPDTRPDNYA